MSITATKLRKQLYAVLDSVLETGQPVVISRKGHHLLIVAEDQPSRLAGLEAHPGVLPDPESIVSPDWTGIWSEETA